MEIKVRNRRVRVSPTQAIGKGSEADVYDIGQGIALKIFKTPGHPDLIGQREEQKNAKLRILEQQKKLLQFPKIKSSRVISPLDFAYQGKKIVGYTMNLVKNAEPIMVYSQKGFRMQGVSNDRVKKIFQDMHNTLQTIHDNGSVVGDYNDLNVLVNSSNAYFIDVDSWQYRNFNCYMFTAKFLDPLLADPKAKKFFLARSFNQEADWYAFAVMYFQSLLFVDPYGGVYRPKKESDRIIENLRPQKRITVFNPEVRYPKPARHYKVLPDDLLDYFEKVFVRD
ncbi:hypothetical protein K8R32_03615 [bacterium]|nr:hypothetical protein [bacterium]